MQDTLVIVFTDPNDDVYSAYLKDLIASTCLRDEDCKAGIVDYSSGGQCVSRDHPPEDGDILIVSDAEIDADTTSILRHYIEKSEKIVAVYHQGATETKGGHKTVIQDLSGDKEVCDTEAHSNSGVPFNSLKQCKDAIEESDEEKYDSAVKQIIDFVCGDPILEAKLDLLHKLLVPPAEDSGEWDQIKEDWSSLMELVEADSEEKEHKEQYNQAWEEFTNDDPQQYSDAPFSAKYCGSEDEKGMLEKLRDELLSATP